ncbi:Acyl-CoA synthetase (AMP-forming)/AMP-acid ligase II [Saccharicrinis carchari]|uniref:Acyl-CoA synthetase (AMP-forming)/AMP-acid ligase II n=1 Tax=Saccharicrinis carchari TaxID=1168039 RepID=A0A521D481_SACCC|nr:AMP-binding protein [Saccharicrinis carchari]SMO66479.1 Acyl-CoA synthetase (AMP-forming)/AMP-acid ligase II [Saccharicrinis carchari]
MNCVNYLLPKDIDTEELFVLGQKETLSFYDLKQQVFMLAGALRKKYGCGNKIILLSPNNNFCIVSYLAIMKSGNVVVPLNPSTEKQQLQFVKAQTGCEVMFVPEVLKRRIEVPFKDVWCEADIQSICKDGSTFDSIEADELDPDTLAQIIYTSGSTAMPKGVMISHRNIIANTSSIVDYLNLTSADIMEVVLPFFYCYGLSLLHTHLRVKGKIVLNNNFIFLGSVYKDFEKYKCTGFAGVPSHFQILMRKSDTFVKTQFPHLRYVTQAGGKLHSVFIEEFRKAKPDIQFIVMYGQTEATARLSYLPAERLDDKLGSLGKGIPGVQLKVVDDLGHAIKPGQIGEIIAKGDNVMLGYYKDEKATAQALRNGWLYTGDLATLDEEGFIYHAARKKEIIKVGGRRVSPKEIEEVIVSIPGVVDCTIKSIHDEVLGEAIKAVVVKNDANAELDENSVKEFCSTRLAAYKIPHIITFTSKMDVNAAGKKVKKQEG